MRRIDALAQSSTARPDAVASRTAREIWHASASAAMLPAEGAPMATARKPALRGRRLVAALWRLVRIYWTSPDARWGALLLAGAVALEFASVQATLYVSDAQRRSVEAL